MTKLQIIYLERLIAKAIRYIDNSDHIKATKRKRKKKKKKKNLQGVHQWDRLNLPKFVRRKKRNGGSFSSHL